MSDNCSETIGRYKEELLHKTPFDFLDQTEAAILKSHMENSISNNLILDCDLKVWQEGELKYRHISAKPVFTPDGKFKGFRGTYRDVTEKTTLFINFKDGLKVKQTVYPLFRNGLLIGRIAHLTDITEIRH